MLTIDLPEPRFHDVSLEPEAKSRELASNTAVLNEPPLLKRLALAEPIVVPITAKQAFSDARISAFLAKQKEHLFFLVRLACSFAPPEGEPIARAWVSVTLEAGDGAGGKTSAVIAMDPEKLLDTQKIERSLKVGANLELGGAKLGFDATPTKTSPTSKLFMAALGIGDGKAAWEMYETEAMKIGGAYVFNMIIQSPARQTTRGAVDTLVEISRKRWGLIPYKAMLAEHPSSKFVCPA
jgi:hypothetical protein